MFKVMSTEKMQCQQYGKAIHLTRYQLMRLNLKKHFARKRHALVHIIIPHWKFPMLKPYTKAGVISFDHIVILPAI